MAWVPPGVEVKTPETMPLAKGSVKYVGQAVAVVLGSDKYGVLTRPSRSSSSTSRCPWSSTPRRRSSPARRWCTRTSGPTTRIDWTIAGGDMDAAWAEADVVLERRIVNHRTAGAPIEPRACVADFRGGRLTLHLTSQNPHLIRLFLAGEFGMSEDRIRVIAPDVGGGFGVKISHYGEEVIAAWAARKLGRPVKWTETRKEHMSSTIHGRDQIDYVKIGAKRDGTIVGLECTAICDFGAYYTLLTPFIPCFTGFVISGCYKIPNLKYTARGVFTNKMATDATRGAGRPEATHLIEVMMEQLAAELGMDPLELRRQELHPEGGLPGRGRDRARLRLRRLPRLARQAARRTSTSTRAGARQRSCARRASTAASASRPGWRSAAWRRRASSARAASACRPASTSRAIVRVHASGAVTAYTGTAPHGQGHDTSFAQIVADRVGATSDEVDVVHGDTGTGPFGLGTYGSRSLAVGGESLASAALKVADKAKRIAAHLLEAAPEDIELRRRQVLGQGLAGQGDDAGRDRRRGVRARRTCPRAWSPGSRRRPSTTRRTSRSRSAPTRASSTSMPRPGRSTSSATSRSTTAARRSTRC